MQSEQKNAERRARLRDLASKTVGEGDRIELIDQYKGGVATELYSIYLRHKDQLTINDMQRILEYLGTAHNFDIPENSHPLLNAALAKGKEFAESFQGQHADLFRDSGTSIINVTLNLLKTELDLRFNEKQQKSGETGRSSPSSSPRLSHEVDSPLRKQEQLREFLGLSREQFEAIPQNIREVACQNAIPKLELLVEKSSASQSRLKPGGQTGMIL